MSAGSQSNVYPASRSSFTRCGEREASTSLIIRSLELHGRVADDGRTADGVETDGDLVFQDLDHLAMRNCRFVGIDEGDDLADAQLVGWEVGHHRQRLIVED